MRILFLESSQIWVYGLPYGFIDNGHKVMISGPLTEKNIPEMLEQFNPDFAVVIGWGVENIGPKQEWIRKHIHEAKIPLVYWAVEDPAFTDTWSIPLIKNIQPDFVFTISQSVVETYKKMGINAEYMDFAYHNSIHCPENANDKYRSSIAVVANGYPDILSKYPNHYRHVSMDTLIRPLLQKNIRIDFWGRNWDEMKGFLGIDIPKEWIHGYLPYKDAKYIYSSADIVIGLQNYTTQVTQRTYEVIASGGLLLTNDTAGVRSLFKPGEDLLVSTSPEETLNLVNYYLNHSKEAQSIRRQGYAAVKRHSYDQRAEYMIKVLSDYGIVQGNLNVNKNDGEIYFFENYSDEKYELYIVNPGDTLWGISKKFGVNINDLIKLNHLYSDNIIIDQVLKIREITNSSPYLLDIFKDLDLSNVPGGHHARIWAKDIVEAAKKYEIPSRLLYSVMLAESSGNPNLVSKNGAIGLMQLHIETAKWLDVNPCNPVQSIDGAARYLKELYHEFGDWKLVVAAYNAGPEKVKKYGGIPPCEETQNYVKNVISYFEAIKSEE